MKRQEKVVRKNIVYRLLSSIIENKILLLLILLGFFVQMLIILPSGSRYCYEGKCGLYFWGVHGRDAIWHLAVAAVSFSRYPIIHPIFAGAELAGYNVLLDFVLFLLSKVGISPLFSFFKLLPVLWFILFTYATVKFAKKTIDSKLFLIPLLFLFYFGGSFSYLFTLFHTQSIWGSGGMLSMQSILTPTNLQLAYSYVMLLGIILIIYRGSFSVKTSLWLAFFIFIQLGLKFYGGVISCFIVAIYLLEMLLQKKWKLFTVASILIGLSALIAVVVFYNPFTSLKTGANLTFSPFAHAHSMIEEPTLFYLKDLTNARYFLYEQGRFSPRLVGIELFSLALFLFFNLGTRILGLGYFFYNLIQRKLTRIDIYVFGGVLCGILLTTLFIQKGDWWNTIQFFYYSIFLSNIFLAEFLYQLIKKMKMWGLALTVIVLVLSGISSIDAIDGFISFKKATFVSDSEIRALNYLKNSKTGIVYIPEHNPELKHKLSPPFPIYAAYDTAYVSALSGQQSYLADEKQLIVTGNDFSVRKKLIEWGDCKVFEDVSYVYEPEKSIDKTMLKCQTKGMFPFDQIYHVDGVRIYRKRTN